MAIVVIFKLFNYDFNNNTNKKYNNNISYCAVGLQPVTGLGLTML